MHLGWDCVGGWFMMLWKTQSEVLPSPILMMIPLFLRPHSVLIGHSLCQHVFCFQGIKAHGSASLSSRRQLSEWLCSDITWLDVTVSCSGQPSCTVLDGKAGGLYTEAWLICRADVTLISCCFTSRISRSIHSTVMPVAYCLIPQTWSNDMILCKYIWLSKFKTLTNVGLLNLLLVMWSKRTGYCVRKASWCISQAEYGDLLSEECHLHHLVLLCRQECCLL